jgi:hypothetical protein
MTNSFGPGLRTKRPLILPLPPPHPDLAHPLEFCNEGLSAANSYKSLAPPPGLLRCVNDLRAAPGRRLTEIQLNSTNTSPSYTSSSTTCTVSRPVRTKTSANLSRIRAAMTSTTGFRPLSATSNQMVSTSSTPKIVLYASTPIALGRLRPCLKNLEVSRAGTMMTLPVCLSSTASSVIGIGI